MSTQPYCLILSEMVEIQLNDLKDIIPWRNIFGLSFYDRLIKYSYDSIDAGIRASTSDAV